MRRYILFWLGVVLIEFVIAPFGGRVFDRFFPEERGFAGMMPDIPFYQWGYASVLALGFILGVAFARWRALRVRTTAVSDDNKSLDDRQYSEIVNMATQDNENVSEKDFPPQYDALLDFYLQYLTPVIHAHRELRAAIVQKGVDNDKVRALALQSLQDESLDQSFSLAESPMIGSPAVRPSFNELTTSIHNSEFSYQECISERDALARSLGLQIKSDEVLSPLWEDWRKKHNMMVQEYENVKTNQRFGILFRPLRASKFGGPIPPI